MSICDFLFSADLCVSRAGEALDRLIASLGLPQPGPAAHVQYPNEGWDVVFALVNKAFSAAPTRLEIIAPLYPASDADSKFGRKVFDRQAPRLWRTHATVVATPDLPGLVERVRRAGARHWFQRQDAEVPFDKLWMGCAVGDLGDYDPGADGGFVFEFIPSDSSAFSPKLFLPPSDEPRVGEAGFRRIRHRAFLVDDLDASLRHLDAVFGWEPATPVQNEPARGYRFIDMSANQPHGAGLRLVQATDPGSQIGKDFAAQGAGPYTIAIAVFDLDATAADLDKRGATYRRLAAGAHEPETILVLSPELGAPIALVPDS